MDRRDTNTPLSESSVSLKLELIQRRCRDLMDEPDELELTLEEPALEDPRAADPYNRHRS
jgi:hypothetical protein